MYDAEKLYPEGYHPWLPDFTMDVSRLAPFISRTAAGGVKYYIVDFGISSYFEGEEAISDLLFFTDLRQTLRPVEI